MLQRCAAFLGGAKHEYIIGESLNHLFSRAKEFNGSSKRILAKRDGLKFNFYLCHGLKDPVFDLDWNVFFPRELK
jgi:hypothetical protein